MKIRPRIFLEGNFFVDITPGTPSAPTIDDGDTHPDHADRDAGAARPGADRAAAATRATQPAEDARRATGRALTYKPTDGAGRRRRTRACAARRAAQSLNDAIRYGARSLKGTAIVERRVPGHRAPRPVAAHRRAEPDHRGPGAQRGAAQGPRHELQHDDGGDRVARRPTCSASIRLLAPTLAERRQRADVAQRLVPEHARLRARDPARRPRDAGHDRRRVPVDRAGARAARARPSCRAWSSELSPATRDLAKVIDATPAAAAAGRPGRQVRDERRSCRPATSRSTTAPLSTGAENYKEFWYTMVGLAGEGQNFDGNGMYVRFQPGGGDQTISTGQVGRHSRDKLFANAILKPLGTRPAYPGKRPPYKPDVPCYKNALPEPQRRADRRRPTAAAPTTRGEPAPQRSTARCDEDGDPQARARLRLRPGPRAGRARSSAATSSPTSASTCPTGCRSSARTSSTTRPSSPPRSR